MLIGISGLTVETGFLGLFRRRGSAGSGKDTAANFLVEDHDFKAIALADPLKRFCREVYGFSVEQLWGPSETRNIPDPRYLRESYPEPKYLTPRHCLTTLGTEWGRSCYENTWIDYTLRVIDRAKEAGSNYDSRIGLYGDQSGSRNNFVITDIRWKNEALAIRNKGGRLVRIKRFLPKVKSVHTSELDLIDLPDDSFDYIINNQGSVDELRCQVSSMVSFFQQRP
jgi:hypothetical protein